MTEVRRLTAEMATCCSHTVGNYFSLYMKSLDHCDLHGQRRSQVMVRNERLYMSSYLCIIVTIGLSGTVTEI